MLSVSVLPLFVSACQDIVKEPLRTEQTQDSQDTLRNDREEPSP